MRAHIIYLHGFNSSPASAKAQQAHAYFSSASSEFCLHVPALPPEPDLAIGRVVSLLDELGPDRVGLIGSSLGGYYSLHLHERFGCPAALVNPAIRPYELLSDYLGENTNLYTGETYIVKAEHMQQLKALESRQFNPEKLFLLTETGDEVLDYRQALDKLCGAPAWVRPFGDHAFVQFDLTLPAIAAFFARHFC